MNPKSAIRNSQSATRRYPIGAEITPTGVHFRVWAPRSKSVSVVIEGQREELLQPEADGYYSTLVENVEPGSRYRYKLATGEFPDPASRFQPEGPHGPSQIVDPTTFQWTDSTWQGLPRQGQIVYEFHVGTLTPEGTWQSAIGELQRFADLGITTLEVMPIADFPGRRGWGYDGVNMFAPTRLYGTPDDFRAFVDRAHALGMGVILDVVYNHFGPDGNYLLQFSENYLTKKRKNDWGDSINFDGPDSAAVREFFISNAAYWIDEFHLDGLRLDATQQIHDSSESHILFELQQAVRKAAGGRGTWIVAENDMQQAWLVRDPKKNGFGMDAAWNDDSHHVAKVALTGRAEAYMAGFTGAAREFVALSKWGYLYQGTRHEIVNGVRGESAIDLEPWNFVSFLQNHDQVANSLRGDRLHALSNDGRIRALTAWLLLGPATPMLFMGQEYGATTPFLFFADHAEPKLSKAVAEGRAKFLAMFPSVASPEAQAVIPNAEADETFVRSKLDLAERDRNHEALALHRDLIALRKTEPHFANALRGNFDAAILTNDAFAIRWFHENDDRLLIVNLGHDIHWESVPEPLLAPALGTTWQVAWSSEHPKYGGIGTPPIHTETHFHVPSQSAILLRA